MTGLSEEAAIAREFSDPATLILCGGAARDQLDKLVPANCEAILSFGLCGGLAPPLQIGQIVLADMLITPGVTYTPDNAWLHRLFLATRAYEHKWYSSGLYNTADTPEQRADLFKATGAYAIDDESYAVAKLAKARNISFAIMRSVSDGANDTVPSAAKNATNPDGTSDLASVLASLESDPLQVFDLIGLADDFAASLDELRTAAIAAGSLFQSI